MNRVVVVKQEILKKLFFFVSFIYMTTAIACDCNSLQPISKELAQVYDVIFEGKVDSVSACNAQGIAIAYFTIEKLYKGNTKQQIAIHFDCSSTCQMSFAKDDEWLIYGNYQRFDVLLVKLCEHSRKQAVAGVQDFYAVSAQRTFEQEKEFLKTTLGIQPFAQNENWNKNQEELKHRNEQPADTSKIYLLLVSFGVMGLIYLLTRKKKNKNG